MEKSNAPSEIIQFAINSEQKAHDFYIELADKVKSKEMRETLFQFADEELIHKQKLSNIIIGTEASGIKVSEVEDLKIGDYLVDKEPHQDMSYQDILIIAMKKEKKAFKLYNDLANRISDSNLKAIFYNLAQEEAKHKLRFEIEYDEKILTEN